MTTIGDFFKRLSKRVEEKDSSAKIFFDCFLVGSILPAINKAIDDEESVDWKTEVSEQRSWEVLYHLASELLWDAACREHSEAHPDIFDEATRISEMFCQEMKESLGFEIESIPIKSPTQVMEEAGYIKVTDGMVELTGKGKRAAEDVK